MRALIALTVGMGVLILLATTVLVVTIVKRSSAPATTNPTVLLDEPAGTRIAGVTAAGDRLAIDLSGGGPDRVVLIDPRSGQIVGRIALSR